MPTRRVRKRRFKFSKSDLVQRALKFVVDDDSARGAEMSVRAQRYAKYRQWRGQSSHGPWEDSSDAAVPDLVTDSLRMQDTLFNAVHATRPAVVSKATSKAKEDQVSTIDRVLDTQLLVENRTEWLSDLIDAFVNDGHYTVFCPWVRENRSATELRESDPLPPDVLPTQHFRSLLQQSFPEAAAIAPRGRSADNPWDFTVTMQDGTVNVVAFYVAKEGAKVEMAVTKDVEIFDGPKTIVKDRADVLHPVNVANLQIPGPSNPGGAPHVVLVDRPTVDEVLRLAKDKTYDEITKEDRDIILAWRGNPEQSTEEQQKDTLEGGSSQATTPPERHNTITRYRIFDMMDLSGDDEEPGKRGRIEDVVYVVLWETQTLCRVRRLSEEYPSRIPHRPLLEQSFIPVRGRRTGIGMLELGEGLHDLQKQLLDQMVDHNTLEIGGYFFYRPSTSMKPEDMRLAPGQGYPVADPKNDIFFPTIPPGGQTSAINLLTMLKSDEERLQVIGDLQLGRVPKGKASALRTASGIAQITAQGEARPERIVRRFFSGLAEIWRHCHELNRTFLPPEKKFRIATNLDPGEDPYLTVQKSEIDAPFDFEFKANVFNISKQVQQDSLLQLYSLVLTPLGFETGVAQADTLYRFVELSAKAFGQDPEALAIHSPLGQKLISAEEAVASIMGDNIPSGFPAEGPGRHMQILQTFIESDNIGHLTEPQTQMLAQWMQVVQTFLQQQQAAQAQAAAAEAQGAPQQGNGAAPASSEPGTNVAPNELLDESLPTAGGGANQGP